MDHIVLTGVKPYDGSYPLDLDREFTTREWGWIKRLAGYLPLTLTDEAFSDPELACVLAVIVLHRAARVERQEVPAVFDKLVDAPFGSAITIETEPVEEGQQEGDAGPPASSSNGSSSTSGDDSTTSSETSTRTPPASGIPGSGSSVSDPATSVT